MLALVYEYGENAARSVVCAHLVAEIEIDEIPEDQIDFARENGGDFIEIMLHPSSTRR